MEDDVGEPGESPERLVPPHPRRHGRHSLQDLLGKVKVTSCDDDDHDVAVEHVHENDHDDVCETWSDFLRQKDAQIGHDVSSETSSVPQTQLQELDVLEVPDLPLDSHHDQHGPPEDEQHQEQAWRSREGQRTKKEGQEENLTVRPD